MLNSPRLCLLAFFLAAPSILPAEDAAVPAKDAAVSTPAVPGSPADLRRQARAIWSRRKSSAAPWLLLGRAYEIEGRVNKAINAYAKALNADPLASEAYYRRGRLFESKGRLDEAANEYQAAIKADGKNSDAAAAWKALSERLKEPVKN